MDIDNLLDKTNIIILLNIVNMDSLAKFRNVQFDIIAVFSMLDTICNFPVIAMICEYVGYRGHELDLTDKNLTILHSPSLQYPTDPKALTMGKTNISRRRNIECD